MHLLTKKIEGLRSRTAIKCISGQKLLISSDCTKVAVLARIHIQGMKILNSDLKSMRMGHQRWLKDLQAALFNQAFYKNSTFVTYLK